MRGNYYFEANTRFASYTNTDEIVRILRASGRVALCVAGHVHWNSITRIDGIPFVTVQSLTESFPTDGEAAGAWALLELGEDLRWRTYGHDPIDVRVPLGGGNRRWAEPLPAFETMRARRAGRRAAGDKLDGVRGLVLDLDGTVYQGSEPITGAAQFLREASERGVALSAVTNNARTCPADYSARLATMGVSLPAERIITAGEATGRYLRNLSAAPRVHIVGSRALRDAVLAAGCD